MMIDEKKLIDQLKFWMKLLNRKSGADNTRYEMLEEVIDLIEEQPKLSLENKIRNNWIPYDNKHEKPNKVGRYRVTELSYFSTPIINFRFWNGKRFEGCEGIIAWQPNPEPYKGEV